MWLLILTTGGQWPLINLDCNYFSSDISFTWVKNTAHYTYTYTHFHNNPVEADSWVLTLVDYDKQQYWWFYTAYLQALCLYAEALEENLLQSTSWAAQQWQDTST